MKLPPEGSFIMRSLHNPAGRDLAGQEAILLVDADPAIRKITRLLLHSFGYTVATASDGDEALHLVSHTQRPVDMLLTGNLSPCQNGHFLPEQMMLHQHKLKVLYMSEHFIDVLMLPSRIHGPIYFLGKPFTYMELLLKVREVFDEAENQLLRK
ncbi:MULTISPECIES: response regulator [Prosthecochloris]|uniref:Response regulator n=1 Tax=Prosthecochloris vibrioformis TaxID=1098 RepID=A0A5C4RYY6_PROVB|nr:MULTISPECIES: response regulator [Prosthecochloris]ANT64751.1 histidine kinase [Prosthecochloris sp. CIB 2401]TNJ36128.1 response regulator [Prosthecochloris vibrioformis]